MERYAHYPYLADLFDFPGPEYEAKSQRALMLVREKYPEAATNLMEFLDGFPKKLLDRQEIYTRTFDVQAITTLDVGYVLFGDDYKRAELLSNLTREQTRAGTDLKGELADHLPNILRLIPKFDEELLKELVSEILVPGLMLMIREFGEDRIEKKNKNYEKHYKTVIETAPGGEATVYRRALSALILILKQDFQIDEVMERLEGWSAKAADFLGRVEKEIEIEKNANPGNSGCDS